MQLIQSKKLYSELYGLKWFCEQGFMLANERDK